MALASSRPDLLIDLLIDPVGDTARWVAAARAREHRRPDRLFADPFAAALAGPQSDRQLERLAAVGGDVAHGLALRTRFLDDYALEATGAGGLRQVVILGAGMDARAFRLAWPAGTAVFEVDQPAVLAEKARVLGALGAEPRAHRRAVPIDLRDAWPEALMGHGFDPARPAVWIAEGLLVYLEADHVDALLARVGALAARGSRLAADVASAAVITWPEIGAWHAALAALGVVWRFGTDEPEQLFARHGWRAQALQPGEGAAAYPERGAFEVIPREIPVPRAFLVTAERRDEPRAARPRRPVERPAAALAQR
jgi:methyltransferase (TIGR00027 family)